MLVVGLRLHVRPWRPQTLTSTLTLTHAGALDLLEVVAHNVEASCSQGITTFAAALPEVRAPGHLGSPLPRRGEREREKERERLH